MNILCRFGFHVWETKPSHREFIKQTGLHIFFWSEGIQKGVKKCTRKSCSSEQKVFREGLVGYSESTTGKWKILSFEREQYIDSLPVL